MEQENSNFENQDQITNISSQNIEENTKCKTNEDKKCNLCKINTILNIALFLAIAVLFYFHFSSAKNSAVSSAFNNTNSLKIAYLNTDSVFSNYLMVKDLRDVLKSEKDKLEAIVMAKQKSFDEKVKNYQTNMQSNSINSTQAQNAEKNLMKERNEIVSISEQYTQQLAIKEAEITRQISDSIINYSKRYNLELKADFILGYTYGAGIIVANEKFDVTKDILNGLNKEYEKSKK